jgi:CheY-like chemotaxis protein
MVQMESTPAQEANRWAELSAACPAATARQECDAPALIRGKAILVVEDDPEVAAVVWEVLCLDEHSVDMAEDGEIALEKLQQGVYDVILSDIRMPRLTGTALYHVLEQRDPQLLRRIIFLTGDTATPEILEFFERTGVPSVSKPFTVTQIRQAVQRILTANADS